MEPVTVPTAESVVAPAWHASALTMATLGVIGREIVAWVKTLLSAAVYATLIVTFGFQVARVEGQSMAPTLANQDRLIVNKFAYLIGSPRPDMDWERARVALLKALVRLQVASRARIRS